MRTQKEIVDRIVAIKDSDFFGFEKGDLVVYLEFEAARPFIKDDMTAEKWAEVVKGSRKDPLQEIRDYLPFAFDKATGHRGLSASRSISHMRAWAWLSGDEKLLAIADDDAGYSNYGMPILIRAAEHLGAPFPDQFAHMREVGAPCRPGCEEGCGQ